MDIIVEFDKLGQISCNVNRCSIAKLKYPLQDISTNKKRPTSNFRVSHLVMKVEYLEHTHIWLLLKKRSE